LVLGLRSNEINGNNGRSDDLKAFVNKKASKVVKGYLFEIAYRAHLARSIQRRETTALDLVPNTLGVRRIMSGGGGTRACPIERVAEK
jgi:hypothetical protein